jgi:hypothetical protein
MKLHEKECGAAAATEQPAASLFDFEKSSKNSVN